MTEIPHWMQDHMADDKRFQEESTARDAAMDNKLDEINKKLDPILDAYKAVLFSRSFVTGLASVIIGITAIGAAIIWIINQSIHKP